MPSPPNDLDRYHARPVDVFDWCVWDIRRNEPVFGSDMLREDEARRTARRMSQAYRRAMSLVEITARSLLTRSPSTSLVRMGTRTGGYCGCSQDQQ